LPLQILHFLQINEHPKKATTASFNINVNLGENISANESIKQNGEIIVYQLYNLYSSVLVSIMFIF